MNWQNFFLDLALRGLIISAVAALAVWKLRGRKRTMAAAFASSGLLDQLRPAEEAAEPEATDEAPAEEPAEVAEAATPEEPASVEEPPAEASTESADEADAPAEEDVKA